MRRGDLAHYLAGDHSELWMTSPSFRAMVTTLAEMLPLMVNGMAAEAEKKDAIHAELMKAVMRPLGPVAGV